MKYIIFLLFIISSCKKYTEVGQPSNQLTSANVFASDATATTAMLSVYSQMESRGLQYSLIVNTGLSSDELLNYSVLADHTDLYTNNLTPDNNLVYSNWSDLYSYVYQCNAILEGLLSGPASNMSAPVKKQLEGEARFTRAYCYFYLVQLFGDVPLLTKTSYLINANAARSDTALVYHFIEADLSSAANLLDDVYRSGKNTSSTERVRPNRYAVAAMQSRVVLYRGKWASAISFADDVINATGLYHLENDLTNVFRKESQEAIWQLMANFPGFNSYAGGFLILTSTPSVVSLQPSFVQGFRTADLRSTAWTGNISSNNTDYYFPYKYKAGQNTSSITEYTMLLRLAEVYLNRAISKAMLQDIAGGLADLNIIRQRSGLPALSTITQQALLDSIATERKYELFCESGDRWSELKRTRSIDQVLTAIKGINWASTDQLYPIPRMEINRNTNLQQNQGY